MVFEPIPGRRVLVRRRVGERFHLDCVVSAVKHRGGSVQVWGCMSRDGVGTLQVVQGRLNAEAYIQPGAQREDMSLMLLFTSAQ